MAQFVEFDETGFVRPTLLSRREASVFLGISKTTLGRLVQRGLLPVVPILSRKLFLIADLEKLVTRCRTNGALR